MLPAQRNKVDISSLSEEEQKMFRLYGKLPNRKDVLSAKLQERKYFDSGDYALSKAGKAPQHAVGTAIPNPQVIPHAATVGSTSPPGAGSPATAAVGAGTAASPPGPSTSPLQAHRGSIGIPGAHHHHHHHASGSIGSANAMSTSPTTPSSHAGSVTGRPAHPQVSAFPIGNSSASAAASTSPTNAAGLAGPAGAGGPGAGGLAAPAAGFAGSPGAHSPAKEASGLGRSEITADDLMEE